MKWWIILVFIFFLFLFWFWISSNPVVFLFVTPVPSEISYNFLHDSFSESMPNGSPGLLRKDHFVTGSGANMVAVRADSTQGSVSELEFFLPKNPKNEKHTIQMGFMNFEPTTALAGILNYYPKLQKYDITCVYADKSTGEVTQSELRTHKGELPIETPMIFQLVMNKVIDVNLLTHNRQLVLSAGLELPHVANFGHAALALQSDFCGTKYSVNGRSRLTSRDITRLNSRDITRLSVTYEETDFELFGMEF